MIYVVLMSVLALVVLMGSLIAQLEQPVFAGPQTPPGGGTGTLD